ncbi:hypothetical protein Tco_0590170 [Tanacetum coccineum]
MRRLNYTIARGNDDTLDKNVLRALNHLTLLGVVDAEALEIVSCASKICDYRGQLMRLRLDERYLSKGVHHRKLLAIVSRDRFLMPVFFWPRFIRMLSNLSKSCECMSKTKVSPIRLSTLPPSNEGSVDSQI